MKKITLDFVVKMTAILGFAFIALIMWGVHLALTTFH